MLNLFDIIHFSYLKTNRAVLRSVEFQVGMSFDRLMNKLKEVIFFKLK